MANLLSQTAPQLHSFRQEQLYLVLYLNQVHSGTAKNQNTVLSPDLPNAFGLITVNDWDIYDDDPNLSKKSKIVARVQGHHVGVSRNTNDIQYFTTSNIVFGEKSCHNGSTLVVIGSMIDGAPRHWTIVGGTGEFTLAQGTIFLESVIEKETSRLKRLHIGVSYTHIRSLNALSSSMFHEFSPSEINDAIANKTSIGEGGFGSVYSATIHQIDVAIKINHAGGEQGKREFMQEVEILKRNRHENLVTLVGACKKRRALVYEFLPNGTLQRRLKNPESFSWDERVRVATSICAALEFLHHAKPDPIAHGDVKPDNILFDANNVCKLGDFGISRQLKYKSYTATPGHTTRAPMGTTNYMDPEFVKTGRLVPPSDVYALGIILLEIATGLPAAGLRYFVSGVLGTLEKQSEDMETTSICETLIDKKLQLDDKSKLDAVKMIRIGFKCSNDTRMERPDLATEVRPELESIIRRGSI